MKRNRPPDLHEQSLDEEQKIVNERLDDLFYSSTHNVRKVPVNNKGTWIDDLRHVKLENLKGISSELVSYSSTLKYHFLEPYEALYCLDSGELIIYNKNCPLTLAEAYQLLLVSEVEFKNYLVFQRLNRTGFICLRHEFNSKIIEQSQLTTSAGNFNDTQQPIFRIDSIHTPFREVMTKLRDYGPKDCVTIGKNLESEILFDVYNRETYNKNKPSKSKKGIPDYFLIIRDYDKDRTLPTSEHLKAHNDDKLLFALIDCESTICFVQLKPTISSKLELL